MIIVKSSLWATQQCTYHLGMVYSTRIAPITNGDDFMDVHNFHPPKNGIGIDPRPYDLSLKTISHRFHDGNPIKTIDIPHSSWHFPIFPIPGHSLWPPVAKAGGATTGCSPRGGSVEGTDRQSRGGWNMSGKTWGKSMENPWNLMIFVRSTMGIFHGKSMEDVCSIGGNHAKSMGKIVKLEKMKQNHFEKWGKWWFHQQQRGFHQ